MASALQKLLRRSHIGRSISTLQRPTPPHQFPALHILDPSISQPGLLGQFFGRPAAEESPAKTLPPPIFPSYPLGLFAEPVYLNLSDEGDAADVESGETDGTVWADSVKKKRKKKMNKHKYKKLRKRLRRQT